MPKVFLCRPSDMETVHWTRHEKRLHREFGRKRWGDEGYAAEELVAELGSAFLCADLGLTPEPRADHASYIENWLRVLKNDKRAIFTAAGYAESAAAFLHGLQPEAETVAEADDDSIQGRRLGGPSISISEFMRCSLGANAPAAGASRELRRWQAVSLGKTHAIKATPGRAKTAAAKCFQILPNA